MPAFGGATLFISSPEPTGKNPTISAKAQLCWSQCVCQGQQILLGFNNVGSLGAEPRFFHMPCQQRKVPGTVGHFLLVRSGSLLEPIQVPPIIRQKDVGPVTVKDSGIMPIARLPARKQHQSQLGTSFTSLRVMISARTHTCGALLGGFPTYPMSRGLTSCEECGASGWPPAKNSFALL